jgi:hypothetical protein
MDVNDEQHRPGAFSSELSVQTAGPATFTVIAPLIWTGTLGDTFTVPVSFLTDFATVPRFLHWKISPYGAYTRAAVLHDWLLVSLADWQEQVEASEGGLLGSAPPANSRDADGIFRRVMQDLGVPWDTRWTMWAAVRWASLFTSRRAYGRNITADLPRMIGMTLLAVPSTLPGAVGVLVSLGISSIVSKLARVGRA